MTCIVGAVDEHTGSVHMGADSCGSDGHRNNIYLQSKMAKIGHEKQRVLFGACGSFRLIDVLRYSLSVPVRTSKSLEEWVRTDFLEAIRSAVKAASAMTITDSVEHLDGQILIGVEGHLFKIQGDLSVLSGERYGMAIGSGVDAARGALHVASQFTYSGESQARARIELALKAASDLISTVSGPFHYEELEAGE